MGGGDPGGAARGARAGRAPARPPPALEAAVGRGETWEEALEDVEWDDGDMLVVGSSAIGPVTRVFLGSRASKIVRNSPVPVVVVPRAAAAELAEEAIQRPSRRAAERQLTGRAVVAVDRVRSCIAVKSSLRRHIDSAAMAGLRERKRRRTFKAIHDAALRLFEEPGTAP